jgi:glycosyltransferase involved in cell wall biosynthesis
MPKWYMFANFGGADVRNGQVQKALALRTLFAKRLGADFTPVDLGTSRSNLRHVFANFRADNVYCVSLGRNGIRAFAFAYRLAARIAGRRRGRPKLYYFVVGGWLAQLAAQSPGLLRFLRQVDVTFVEAEGLAAELRRLGVNAQLFPNFRFRLFDAPKPLASGPVKLCFCARIRRDKGALLAAAMAQRMCAAGQATVLDFYGAIDGDFGAEFEACLRDDIVRYRGSYRTEDEAMEIMRAYDFLVLPTSYAGECMPGAVVEAFCVATPAVISDWRFNSEVVDDGRTGFVVGLKDFSTVAAERLAKARRAYSEAAALEALNAIPEFRR